MKYATLKPRPTSTSSVTSVPSKRETFISAWPLGLLALAGLAGGGVVERSAIAFLAWLSRVVEGLTATSRPC